VGRKAARNVRVTLGVGIVLLLAVGAVTLTHSPPRVVQVNTKQRVLGGTIIGDAEVCQANEVLPADVSALRLGIGAYFGPRVKVRALSGSLVLTEGAVGPTWTGTSVTIPVNPLSHATSGVKLCMHVGPNSELVFFKGAPARASESASYGEGALLGGRVAVEYLAPGDGSWWSRILEVARHMGIGHALSGTWVVLLIAALVSAVGVLAVGVVWREFS
jgi:hypothetical protein